MAITRDDSSPMLVSTIVPVYNGVETLRATVDSLLAQTYSDHEIILVDDGSSDDSPALLRELGLNEKIKPLFKENGGVGDARNFGAARASGQLLAFCDQDDTWEPEKLSLQVPLFARETVGLVFGGIRTEYPDRSVERAPPIPRPSLEEMLEDNRISCCTAIVRRSLFEAVGGFDADRVLAGVDDWHLWIRLLQHTEADSIPTPVATHIIHGDNYSLREATMRDAAILCLDKLSAPAHQPTITAGLLRNARRRVYEHYGRNMLHNGDFNDAAGCFGNAWLQGPGHLSNLLKALALRCAPDALLHRLQQRKRAGRVA